MEREDFETPSRLQGRWTDELQSFSSIVGPNGSGKSNTIDALLFVFGYRASKMRQGKLSELIHNSGPSTTKEEVSNEESMAPVVEAGEEEYDSGDDTDDGRKKKGKGKKDKGKKKVVENTDGLIGSCTVEVWFREIIDLVSLTASCWTC